MGMMQMPFHEVVHMVAMRHRLVSAARTMDVAGLMPSTAVIRRASVRVCLRYFDHVLVDVVTMRMVQMPVMQIVDMVSVPYRSVPATIAMRVGMVRMVGL
jgi:hypothetical protein